VQNPFVLKLLNITGYNQSVTDHQHKLTDAYILLDTTLTNPILDNRKPTKGDKKTACQYDGPQMMYMWQTIDNIWQTKDNSCL